MSELAFDKEGNPFRFSRRTKKLRPRRWKNAGQRGTCAAVLGPDGEQLLIDANADYAEFRAAVGNVPGFYRLDQCDEDGALIEDVAPAYVSIESGARNAASVGELDSRDALIRDLAQINAEMTRTIVERFSNVMQAAAAVLKAADGAGLPRREPPPPLPAPASDDDNDDDDDDDDDDDEQAPPESPFGSLQPFVEMAMPHLPKFGAFLWVKFQEFMKQNATPSPSAPPPAMPAAAPASAAAPAAGGVAAGPSAPAPVVASAPVLTATPAPAPAPASATASPTGPVPAATASSIPAAAATSEVATSDGAAPDTVTGAMPAGTVQTAPAAAAAPVAAAVTAASASATTATAAPIAAPAPASTADMPPATVMGEGPAAPVTTLNAAPAEAGQLDGPRNAPPVVEPTAEQWAHLLAIRARLSPREATIANTVVPRMPPKLRAQWLAELSVLSVDEAAEVVRSLIPKTAPKQARRHKGSEDDGQEES